MQSQGKKRVEHPKRKVCLMDRYTIDELEQKESVG
jgi:hypothetical protein